MTKKVAESAASPKAGLVPGAPSAVNFVGAAALAAAGKAVAQAAPGAERKTVVFARDQQASKAAKAAIKAQHDDRADEERGDEQGEEVDAASSSVMMVDAGTAGGGDGAAALNEAPQAGGGGAAPASNDDDADKGGIGSTALIIGGLVLAGGGVALAAGGGKKNTPPTVTATQAVTTNEDTKATITVSASDADNDTLTYANSTPSKGTVTASGNSFVYTPNANVNGTDSFTVTVSDGRGGSVTQTVNITITPVNDLPVPVAGKAAVMEDASVSSKVTATDVDGDTLTFALAAPVAGLTMSADGGYTFDAKNAAYQGLAAGATKDVVANYTVSDGKGGTATSTLTVTVTGANDDPVAVADTLKVTEDAAPATGSVATNDSDADTGAVLTFALNAPVAGLTLNSNGSYSFDASNAAYQGLAAGATKDVVANYTVTDDKGATATSTLTITVTGANDAPVATAAKAGVTEDATITGQMVASDVDAGATLDFTLNAPVAGLTLNSNGSYSFDAGNAAYQSLATGATKDVVANVTVTDDKGATAATTLTLTVTGTNDAPVAKNVALTVAEDTNKSGSITATDVDTGATLSYSLNAPAAGLTLSKDGSFSFDGANAAFQSLGAGQSKDVVANYTVTDDKGATSTASFTITVTGANDAPVMTSAKAVTFDENLAASTVLYKATATDVDAGTALTYSLAGAGADAALFTIDSATGDVRLRAPANFEARTSYALTVRASDGTATTEQALALTVANAIDDLRIDGGDAQTALTVDARGTAADVLADVNYRFLEELADPNEVVITNFGANDAIQFDSEFTRYNFTNTAGDLVIVGNNGGDISRIVIDNILSPTLLLQNSAQAANAALNAALNTTGVQYLQTTAAPSVTTSLDTAGLTTLSAAGANVTYTDSNSSPSTVVITDFAQGDRIVVSGIVLADPDTAPNFEFFNEQGGAALDLIITFQKNGVINSITLVDFVTGSLPPELQFGDRTEAAIEDFIGFDFFQYA